MEKWQIILRLRLGKIPWRRKICFSFEWKAWLIAYDYLNMTPEEFSKTDSDKQISVLAFGAASWDRMKKGKNVYFTPGDIEKALLGASKADNIKVINAMSYARFPGWLKETGGTDKKKEET